MPARSIFLKALARSFLAGKTSVEQIVSRGERTLGRRWRSLRPLAKRYVEVFVSQRRPHPRLRDVIQFLGREPIVQNAWRKHRHEISIAHWLTEPQQMRPVAAARSWGLPAIVTVGDLADWFHLRPGELEWFADLKGLGYKQSNQQLRHYHYRILTKQYGNVRLIEIPKPWLKEMQRQILAEILERIPSHPVVHGFIKGRSIKTFASPHVGKRVVLRMDLQNFFPSFPAARVSSVFRTMGYPESVADLLGGICTNATPRDAWKEATSDVDRQQLWEARKLYSRPHLPQGAPTSPMLANVCSYRMDCRLTGLAESAGASYTRYADDLAFSGDEEFEKRVDRFSTNVAAILVEEGFTVHHRKTRIMRKGMRQHLAGLVANQHVNVVRRDFDLLKAILTNCVRLGPDSQNRDGHPSFRSHLEGRVGFVEMIHPTKGKRLRRICQEIKWPNGASIG
jgi:hypothetical protein